MTHAPFDPTRRPDDAAPSDEPRLLPSIDAASPLGRALRDSLERLRFAPNIDPAVRDAVQQVLDGRSSARDLIRLPELQPLADRAAATARADIASLSEEERAELFGRDARGRDA